MDLSEENVFRKTLKEEEFIDIIAKISLTI